VLDGEEYRETDDGTVQFAKIASWLVDSKKIAFSALLLKYADYVHAWPDGIDNHQETNGAQGLFNDSD
jgi:hypothetical protein